MKQRPQYLAEELSKWHEVWYVDPTISGMRCLKLDGTKCTKYCYNVTSNLHIIRPSGLLAAHIKLQYYDIPHINTYYERQQLKKLFSTVDIIWVGYEACYRLVRHLYRRKPSNQKRPILIYDKMDDNVMLEQHPSIKKFLSKMRKDLEQEADIVFVTANLFYKELSSWRSNVFLVPNGATLNHLPKDISFAPNSKPSDTKKCFGYLGMISHWFDRELVESLSQNQPECKISLVGPVAIGQIQAPNVTYYGKVPKTEVFQWISQFDICLYPFKREPLLDTIDPVKIYEYLSLNKPVIAANSMEMEKYSGLIYTYNTQDEFLKLCSQPILHPPFSNKNDLFCFFRENSWKCRAEQILNIINTYAKSRSINL